MPDDFDELAVGESLVVSNEGDALRVETTRSDEHLFTTTYRDPETGTLRLALQIDITTGDTALDPRSFDANFWTLDVGGAKRPGTDLEDALCEVDDPGLEVNPEQREIRIYPEGD
ncbi:MAG: hypothetical protein ABEL51_12980 [Salinibacter sp.]